MPKQTKSTAKSKAKLKHQRKNAPEVPGVTTKKSYWVILTVIMAFACSVAGYMLKLSLGNIAVLTVTIVLMICLTGYVRVEPSNLPVARRATFLFVGASVIGFGIWAIVVLVLGATGLMLQIGSMTGDQFFVLPSFITSLIVGAFIGELLGKNRKVQEFFFKPEEAL
jgi:hypothetical protein